MLEKLRQPFPDKADFKQSLITIVWVGVFVGLFLYLIRPFGIEGTWADLAKASAGFGAVTVVFGWLFELTTRFVLRIRTEGPDWTLGRWMLMSIVLIGWIAIGNFLFVNLITDWRAMGYFNFMRMIGYTSLVGVFPVVLSGVAIQLRATRKNEESANEMSNHLQPKRKEVERRLTLELENGQRFEVNASDIRFVEAMQNYVTVWHFNNGRVGKEMLRSTLASVEEQCSGTAVVRCHRSFLVNSECIDKVSGNAQGLRLKLRDMDGQEVPVSRSYIPKLRALLNA